jgi:hypothetical protein
LLEEPELSSVAVSDANTPLVMEESAYWYSYAHAPRNSESHGKPGVAGTKLHSLEEHETGAKEEELDGENRGPFCV